MSTALVTGYAVASFGLLLAIASMAATLKLRINVAAANQQVVKLARMGNLDRARKLCSAAPGCHLDAIKAAIVATESVTKDRVVVEGALSGAFDEVGKPLDKRWRTLSERSL